MAGRYILAILACTFLAAGVWGLASGRPRPQSRTWLLLAGIFTAASLWLFSRG